MVAGEIHIFQTWISGNQRADDKNPLLKILKSKLV